MRLHWPLLIIATFGLSFALSYAFRSRPSADNVNNGQQSTPTRGPASSTPTTEDQSPPPNPALDTFLDPSASSRFTDKILQEIPEVPDSKSQEQIANIARDPEEGDTIRNESIDLLRKSGYPHLDRLLWEILQDQRNQERFRSFATQHLGIEAENTAPGSPKRTSLAGELRTLLEDRHEDVRREALGALSSIKDSQALMLIHNGLNDPNWSAHKDLIVYLMDANDFRDRMPAIRSLAYSPDDALRIACLTTLGNWKDEGSRAAFEDAVRSDSLRLRRAGTLALKRLDGAEQSFPSMP